MTRYSLWKIKPGKDKQWREWCYQLSTEHREEAIETLREENLTREACFFLPNGLLLYAHEIINKKLPATDRDINIKHRQMMEDCLEPITETEDAGYDLSIE